jgi:hypothetical protein
MLVLDSSCMVTLSNKYWSLPGSVIWYLLPPAKDGILRRISDNRYSDSIRLRKKFLNVGLIRPLDFKYWGGNIRLPLFQ